MTESREGPLYQLIWQTRRLFQRLAREAERIEERMGVTASQRAVLEFLAHAEPQTVPQIARQRAVSRQHVQVTVNALAEAGLVEIVPNPGHKRSGHVRRTRRGRELFARIRERETRLLAQAASRFDPGELRQASEALRALDNYFQSPDWESTRNQVLDGETQ
ncbi:MAG: MarR family transcriptional regulator [Gammaproteobacteria bacterium]|nr:MarR family transcriptional regulator [Gammaproteobacteria bacterium]